MEKVLLLEDKRFYVYIYLDPRKPGNFNYEEFHFDFEPFYVGKGKEKRAWDHLFSSKKEKSYKSNKINKILKTHNLEPVFVLKNISEKNAFELEIRLIRLIGRLDLKTGTLTNMTGGGEGVSGLSEEIKRDCYNHKGVKNPRYGVVLSAETREKISKANTGKKQSKEQIQKRLDHTDRSKLGWSKGLKRGCNITENGKERLRQSKLGKIWIKNLEENIQKYVDKNELDLYINNGWQLGMLPKKKRG